MNESLDITVNGENTRGWPKTSRQLGWARFYVIDGFSAYDSAIKAGYAPTTAKSKSYELTKKLAPFLTHLQRHKNGVARVEFHVTTERIVQSFAAIALSRICSYHKAVTLKDGIRRVVGKSPEELTADQEPAVKAWTVVEHEGEAGTILDYQYVFHDPIKPLVALAKHLGLFNERLQVEGQHKRARGSRLDLSGVSNEVLEASLATMYRVREDLRLSAAAHDERGGDLI